MTRQEYKERDGYARRRGVKRPGDIMTARAFAALYLNQAGENRRAEKRRAKATRYSSEARQIRLEEIRAAVVSARARRGAALLP